MANRKRKGLSLVSENKHMSVSDFMKKLSSIRKHEAIVHVETDFGPVCPVLCVWDESNRSGEGEDLGDIGYVTLVYSIEFEDPKCAAIVRPCSVSDILERLGRIKNPNAVIHTGGTELTPEPVTAITDNTHELDDSNCIGSVRLV